MSVLEEAEFTLRLHKILITSGLENSFYEYLSSSQFAACSILINQTLIRLLGIQARLPTGIYSGCPWQQGHDPSNDSINGLLSWDV